MDFTLIKDIVEAQKQLFKAYIADTTEPLKDRWQAFCSAPEYLKNDMGYMVCELDHYFGDEVVRYGGPVHVERYQEMTSEDVVEAYTEFLLDGGDAPTYTEDTVNTVIDPIKERLLADNFGRFTYDW